MKISEELNADLNMFNDCQPAGDVLLILVDLRMWYMADICILEK